MFNKLHFWGIILLLFLSVLSISSKKEETTLKSKPILSASASVLEEDSLALVALYNATGGENWNSSANWLETEVAMWDGITVEDNRVVGIELPNNNLVGAIPSDIEDLDSLSLLNLSGNSDSNINSAINSLTALANLRELGLAYTELNSLPPSINKFKKLEILILRGNNLSELPPEIGELNSLQLLALSDNHNLAQLPPEIGNLTSLGELLVNFTYTISELPVEIVNLKNNLYRLEIMGNNFSSIPEVVWELTNLTQLKVSENTQISYISGDIGNLTKLTDLEASYTQISSLPNKLWNLTDLTHLFISHNQISSLPTEIGQLTNLEQLLIQNNYLTVLPEEIWTLDKLHRLLLNNNQLSELPAEIENLTNLKTLYLSSNGLNSLPTAIKNANDLENLYLENNHFNFSDLENLVQEEYNCSPWIDECLIYAPQGKIGMTKIDTVKVLTPFEMIVPAGGTEGSTTYHWFKDGEPLEEGNGVQLMDSVLTILTPISENVGTYTCEATNEFAVDLTLKSEPQYLVLPAKTFTINQNGAGDYNSIQAAINDLNNGSIVLEEDESIIFDIIPGSGPYDEQVIIPEIQGTSPTSTININGNGNTLTSTATDCEQPAILQLDGADFVVISDLMIKAAQEAEAAWGIHLKNEADTIQIVNCVIDVDSLATDPCFAGIVASNSDNTYLDNNAALGLNANSTTIKECDFVGGHTAIAMIGSADTTMVGPNIVGNTVINAYQTGVLVTFSNGAVVDNNEIDMTNSNGTIVPSGNESTSIAYKCVIGQLQDYFKKKPMPIDPLIAQQGLPVRIQSNQLKGIQYRGIDINDCYRVGPLMVDWPQAPLFLIVNNTLEGSFVASSSISAGICVQNSRRLNFYHNSVEISGANSSAIETAFFVTASKDLGILNNSLAYTGTDSNGYSIYIEDTSSLAWDYNNYYKDGDTNLAHYNGMDYNNKDAIPGNDHSISTQPTFIFTSNDNSELLDTASIGVAKLVTSDFEGDARPDPITLKPDIGANEFVIGVFDSTFNQTVTANSIEYNSPNQWKHVFIHDSITISINSTSNLGELTTDLYLNEGSVREFEGKFYLDRNFRLAANAFPSNEAVQIRLYITQRELDKLMAVNEQIQSFKDLNLTYLSKENEGGAMNTFLVEEGTTKFFTQTNSQQISKNAYLLEYSLTGIGELGEFWLHGGDESLVVGIEEIPISEKQPMKLWVAPNPFDDNPTLQFHSPSNSQTKIIIRAISSEVVYEDTLTAVMGENNYSIDFPTNVPIGMYLVEVIQREARGVIKVIKR